MAPTKAKPPTTDASSSSPPSSAHRPANALFLLTFAAIATTTTWLMRVETVLQGVPRNFQAVVDAAKFENGTPLVARYTGVTALDEVAKFLVAAFMEGTAGWDVGVRAHQTWFLMNWFAIICVWSVEACRRRNAGRVISFIALFSSLYQVIGAAVIAPIYYLIYAFTSSGDAYHQQGREVPIGYAKALLPAVIIGYLAPTVALWYVPLSSLETVQFLTAFWQPTPLYASALLLIFSFLVSSSSTEKNGDAKYLKRVYVLAALASAFSHIHTLYCAFTLDDPRFSLGYVFLPNRDSWKDSMGQGLHYIFQIDAFGAFGSSLFWCWLMVYDSLRVLGQSGVVPLVKAALGIVLVTLIAGPGTAIAIVFHWREKRLIMIENGSKKAKSA
ncbi:hypothetical protein M426DRAFT_316256 [Hypoxylon sp. CI-4A]|nr:hypothetical protein M426DRAFT_316256 [Hypoxylon sp. CI-4A]